MRKDKEKIIDKIMEIANEHKLSACFDYIKEFGCEEGRNENSRVLITSFLETFPGLSEEFLYQIYISSNFLFWSIYISDKILDEKTDKLNKEALMLSFLLREKSMKIMGNLFPRESGFWHCFDKYNKEYTEAVIHEANYHFDKFNTYTFDELEMIYNGKASLAKFIPAALAFKSCKEEVLASIEDSIKYFYIAYTIKDDVSDWRKDYQDGQYTYLLTKVVVDNKLESELNDIDVQDIGKHVFFSGLANETLELSLGYFQKALESVKEVNCAGWKNFINVHIENCSKFNADVYMLVQKQLTKAGAV